MAYALGLDYGTNSVRCLIVDTANGRELGTCIYEYETGEAGIILDASDHNVARQNPADYLKGVEVTVAGAIAEARKAEPAFDPKKIVDFLYASERMPKSVGVPMEDLQKGIKNGIRKINVDTDGRMAVTAAILGVMQENPKEFDPRKYLGPARDAVYGFAKNAMEGFGSPGHMKDVENISLDDMAKRYK